MRIFCSATSEEFSISLSKEEIDSLETKVLQGNVKIPAEKSMISRPISILLGETPDRYQVFIKHNPENSYYRDSKDFKFIVSPGAYQDLKKTGRTGERIYSSIKVLIHKGGLDQNL